MPAVASSKPPALAACTDSA